jgi:hypothetical protein
MQGIRRFFENHRRRLARLLAVCGIATVAMVLAPQVPTELEVELQLPTTHREFVEVRLTYLDQGEELQGARLAFPGGAPSRVHHTARLPSGDVEVHAVAVRTDGRALSRSTRAHAPVDGTLVIRLDGEQP